VVKESGLALTLQDLGVDGRGPRRARVAPPVLFPGGALLQPAWVDPAVGLRQLLDFNVPADVTHDVIGYVIIVIVVSKGAMGGVVGGPGVGAERGGGREEGVEDGGEEEAVDGAFNGMELQEGLRIGGAIS
jgi:hypothetical protein